MTPVEERVGLLARDLKSFVGLLAEEARVLAAGDPDQLARLTAERQNLGLGIAEHWKTLATLLGLPAQAGFAALREQARRVSPVQSGWSQLEDLAREAAHLNQVNGRMIEEQLRRNQAAIQVLQNAGSRRGLYGADGRVTDFLNVNRSIDTA